MVVLSRPHLYDKGGEIHIILSVEMGDSAHYSRPEDPDPVAKFISTLMPERTKLMSMTFKKPNVIDEVRAESRDDCLVIHNAKGAPYISICALMEVLEVDKNHSLQDFRKNRSKAGGADLPHPPPR